MKKYLYLLVTGLLCVTINTQIGAHEYDVNNTTNNEIDITLRSQGTKSPKSITKTIAPHSTANFNFEDALDCLGTIIYLVNPSKYRDIDRKKYGVSAILGKWGEEALEKNYTPSNPVCKSAKISIEPSSRSYEVKFVLK